MRHGPASRDQMLLLAAGPYARHRAQRLPRRPAAVRRRTAAVTTRDTEERAGDPQLRDYTQICVAATATVPPLPNTRVPPLDPVTGRVRKDGCQADLG